MKAFLNKRRLLSKAVPYLLGLLLFISTPLSVNAAEDVLPDTTTDSTVSDDVSFQTEAVDSTDVEINDNDISDIPTPPTEEIPAPEPLPETPDISETLPAAPDVTPAPSPNTNTNAPVKELPEEKYDVEAFTATYYAVSKGGLNIRKGPSTDYDIIGTLAYGDSVSITGKTDNNWYQILYNNNTGYVSSKYVSEDPVTEEIDTPEEPEQPETSSQVENTNTASSFSILQFISQNLGLIALLLAILIIVIVIIVSAIFFFRNGNGTDEEYDAEYDDAYYADGQNEVSHDGYYEDEYDEEYNSYENSYDNEEEEVYDEEDYDE